jgi:hypothetical protein
LLREIIELPSGGSKRVFDRVRRRMIDYDGLVPWNGKRDVDMEYLSVYWLWRYFIKSLIYLAPRAGFEPATNRLTAGSGNREKRCARHPNRGGGRLLGGSHQSLSRSLEKQDLVFGVGLLKVRADQ